MGLKHFKREEFDCQVTGTNNMEQEFLEKLDQLRGACGFMDSIEALKPMVHLQKRAPRSAAVPRSVI